MEIFLDLFQQAQIGQLQAQVDRAKSNALTARVTAEYVRQLEDRIDRLTLICMAMWRLLQKSGQFKEEDLAAEIHAIDLEDGTVDGKVQKPIVKCANCGKTIPQRNTRCIYCGELRPANTPFDRV